MLNKRRQRRQSDGKGQWGGIKGDKYVIKGNTDMLKGNGKGWLTQMTNANGFGTTIMFVSELGSPRIYAL